MSADLLPPAPPSWMVTYWCPRCELDSGRTEQDSPFCFCCARGDELLEIAREPLSPDAIARRLQRSADRMMESLQEAYAEGMAEDELETFMEDGPQKEPDTRFPG